MDDHSKIISFIRMKGPSLPVEIAGHLGKDSFLVSAMLSELVSSKKLFLSNIMVGRSRLYFLPEQKPRLESFAKYLNEKDKNTYELIKKKNLLRDKSLDTLTRVSLRNIKDFAVPLEANINGNRELFWKWFLLDNEEAKTLIREELSEQRKELGQDKINKAAKEAVAKPVEEHTSLENKGEPENTKKQAQKKESAQEDTIKKQEAARKDNGSVKDGSAAATKKGSTADETESVEEKQSERQGLINDQVKIDDEFGARAASFLAKKNIRIVSFEIIRKKSDIDLDILVPSPVGELCYYCKARKKKSINEGDLSSAFVTSQMKKLPAIFLTNGKLTKKAQEKLDKEMKSLNIVYLK